MREVFDEADRVMAPLLANGRSPGTSSSTRPTRGGGSGEADLMRTEVTQPAVLAADLALAELLGELRRRSRTW